MDHLRDGGKPLILLNTISAFNLRPSHSERSEANKRVTSHMCTIIVPEDNSDKRFKFVDLSEPTPASRHNTESREVKLEDRQPPRFSTWDDSVPASVLPSSESKNKQDDVPQVMLDYPQIVRHLMKRGDPQFSRDEIAVIAGELSHEKDFVDVTMMETFLLLKR